MPAGKRRTLVTIEQSTEADDASGQPLPTWSTFIQRWGDFEATGGSERFRGRQVSAQVTHVVELLSDSQTRAITPGMRLAVGTKTVNITVARELNGEKKLVELQGIEVVDP